MGIKGCWTCRDRKVRCDSHRPRCGNCIKARCVCQGYGMQLSWPREGDQRRARVLQDTHHGADTLSTSVKSFLNTSSWDILLSEELEGQRVSGARYLRTMKVPRPNYLSPMVISREESHLLGFCMKNDSPDLVNQFTDHKISVKESRSLILGPTDEAVLAQFIMRVALSSPSDAPNPVLQGVFALASLQLYGSVQSFRYKHLVISAVKGTVKWLDEKTLLQNLMATMLLYHYELSLESNSKGHWVEYLCAVKKIINTSPAIQKLVRQEYAVFLDWIYYHEVLAEFTIRHWKVPYEGCGFAPTAKSPRAIEGPGSQVEDNIGCPIEVLELVVHACRRAIVPKTSDKNFVNAGMEQIEVLEQRISSALGQYGPVHVQPTTPLDRNTMISDLHRLACLIYVNRASHGVSGTEFRHQRLVKGGISLLSRMETCQNAWPLFIIACEAVDDQQRLAILDVFQQSRQNPRRRSSHINVIQHMVEAVWKQHDLNLENGVDHLAILNAVVGSVPFIPPFA